MSLYQRQYRLKDGTMSYTWIYDFECGRKRYRGSFGHMDPPQAQAMYAELMTTVREEQRKTKIKALEQRLGLTLRFEAFAQQYLAYDRAHARPRSAERHESSYRTLKPVFGPLRLSDITPFLIEQYKEQRRTAGRSAVTINRELGFLQHLFTMAITWGKTTENPVKRVRRLREPQTRLHVLTGDEERQLLAACNPHLKPLVLVALHTGCRRSELLSLRWADVDLPYQRLTVQAAYAKDGQTRSIPMNAIVLQTLEALPRTDDLQALVFGYHDVKQTFRRAADRAGLKGFRFHDLRHAFASRQAIDVLTFTESDHTPERTRVNHRLASQKVSRAAAQAIVQALAQLGLVDLQDQGTPA